MIGMVIGILAAALAVACVMMMKKRAAKPQGMNEQAKAKTPVRPEPAVKPQPAAKPEPTAKPQPAAQPQGSRPMTPAMQARLDEELRFRRNCGSMDPMELKDRAATLLSDGWELCDEQLMLLVGDFGGDAASAQVCLRQSLSRGGITQQQYMMALAELRRQQSDPIARFGGRF